MTSPVAGLKTGSVLVSGRRRSDPIRLAIITLLSRTYLGAPDAPGHGDERHEGHHDRGEAVGHERSLDVEGRPNQASGERSERDAEVLELAEEAHHECVPAPWRRLRDPGRRRRPDQRRADGPEGRADHDA